MPVDKYRHCNMTIYMIFAFQIWYFPTKKKNVIHLFKLLLCEHKVWYVYLAIVQMNIGLLVLEVSVLSLILPISVIEQVFV